MKTFLCLALLLLTATISRAGIFCHCDDCGSQASCCKVCRCVPSKKKVTKTEYECECEDFCVPGKSSRCKECDECGHKKWVYTPTCAHVRTRKKLVKKDNTKEVCTVKWVVENLCPNCCAKVEKSDSSAMVLKDSEDSPAEQEKPTVVRADDQAVAGDRDARFPTRLFPAAFFSKEPRSE
jgi:hypothetical protein